MKGKGNPGEECFEEVNLLCALNRGQTLGVNVFTREMSAALTSRLATVTLFDTACGKGGLRVPRSHCSVDWTESMFHVMCFSLSS